MRKKFNMLRSRYIPVLLIDDGELVKTKQFNEGIYVGDPINAIRIFNEKRVDELCLFDISVTVNNGLIDFSLLRDIAVNANMPLAYGGGIKSVSDAAKIISLGFEKVSLSSIFFETPSLVDNIASEIGAQSVAICLDLKREKNEFHIYTHRGKRRVNINLSEALELIEKKPIGELIVNCIDRDGTFSGYDLEIAKFVRQRVSTNLTFLGGCRDVSDLSILESAIGICGCAAGSYFTFVGKNNAVLLNYKRPNL